MGSMGQAGGEEEGEAGEKGKGKSRPHGLDCAGFNVPPNTL